MTLGGLALAVGILVDDATVEVENINRNREAEPEKDMDAVVLDSASQIATPAFVSTLSICIVFASDVLVVWRRAVSLCAARRSSGLRYVGFLPAFPDDRADDGQVFVAGRETRSGSTKPQSAGTTSEALRRGLREIPSQLSRACWKFASTIGVLF